MTVSRYVKSVKDYFNIIITIAVERPECDVYMAGLCEGTKLLMLRMQRMNAYMKKRPLKKVVSAGLVMMVFGVSAVTVAASSIGYAKGYSYIADKTQDNEIATIEDVPQQDFEEKTEKLSKSKTTIILDEKIPRMNGEIAFSNTIKAGQRLESKKVKKPISKEEQSLSCR